MSENTEHLTTSVGDALVAAMDHLVDIGEALPPEEGGTWAEHNAERIEADAQAYEQASHPTMGGDHSDRRSVEALEEASSVLRLWIDERTGSVVFDHGSETIEHVAKRRAQQTGVNPYQAAKSARKALNSSVLKQWVLNPETGRKRPEANKYVLGSVQAYLGEQDGPPFLLYPDAPVFVFTTLDVRSPRYREGECEAMCVLYQSEKLQERTWTDRSDGTTETYEVMDDMDFGGTVGVVKYYPTAQQADEDRERLLKAVRSFQRAMNTADVADREPDQPQATIDEIVW